MEKENIYLKLVSLEDKEQIYSLLSSFEANESGFKNEFAGMSKFEFFEKGLPQIINWSKGNDLLKNYVPVSFYFLFVEKEIIGVFKLRHYLNEYYRKGPGHISYAIKKEKRGKGYGKIGLHLAIKEINKICSKEDKLIKVCCNKKNFGSYLIILGNLPEIIKEKEKEHEGKIIHLYEFYIERNNICWIKKFKNDELNELIKKYINEEYFQKLKKRNDIIFYGIYENFEVIGYFSLIMKKEEKKLIIDNFKIFKNLKNIEKALLNYIYGIGRVNEIEFILIKNDNQKLNEIIDNFQYSKTKENESVIYIKF